MLYSNTKSSLRVDLKRSFCFICFFICLYSNVSWSQDSDGDGVTNSQEKIDKTNPNDMCSFILANITVKPSFEWDNADCDGDGLINDDEVSNGTDPLNFCDPIQSENPIWNNYDCDGDGVTNAQENIDGTDLLNLCSFITESISLPPSEAWYNSDCDEDGVLNQKEITDNTNFLDPCSYLESSISVTPGNNWNSVDCDGDGVPNGQEVIDFTNPLDHCNFIESSITLPVTNTFPCKLSIPEGFSPNGDGINDFFVITGLELLTSPSILILNRWGNKVFEASPYKNNWDGTNRFGITSGEHLPEGTYFYIIETSSRKSPIKGYVYLKK